MGLLSLLTGPAVLGPAVTFPSPGSRMSKGVILSRVLLFVFKSLKHVHTQGKEHLLLNQRIVTFRYFPNLIRVKCKISLYPSCL